MNTRRGGSSGGYRKLAEMAWTWNGAAARSMYGKARSPTCTIDSCPTYRYHLQCVRPEDDRNSIKLIWFISAVYITSFTI